MSRYNRIFGFTLIELLVVMALLAISLSIILPISVKQVESSRQRAEREIVVALIKKVQIKSYFNSGEFTINFVGKTVTVSAGKETTMSSEISAQPTEDAPPQQASEQTPQLILNHISFTDARLQVQPSLSQTPAQIEAAIGGRKWQLRIENEEIFWSNAD